MPAHADEDAIFQKHKDQGWSYRLYLARKITEFFGGAIEYSEENASRENGFGMQWKLNKPKGQDSEDVKTEGRYHIT